jgi:hypothetical protein
MNYRFNDEEIRVLLRLVTCHPKPSSAGVRFISLGLCMLLSCPYLLGLVDIVQNSSFFSSLALTNVFLHWFIAENTIEK